MHKGWSFQALWKPREQCVLTNFIALINETPLFLTEVVNNLSLVIQSRNTGPLGVSLWSVD